MLAYTLIETSALWKIIAASFAAGAGVVIAFGFVLLGRSRLLEKRQGSIVIRAGYGLLVIFGIGFCIAALVIGLWAMTKK